MEKSTGKISGHWWDQDAPHEHVFGLVKFLNQTQSIRRTKDLTHARLYSNTELLGLDSSNYFNSQRRSTFNETERIRLNVIASVVDTVSSKIAKNKPKIVLLPSAGDDRVQKRAKKLERFISGIFNQTNIYECTVRAFLDACVFGTGAVKVFGESGNICVERVLPSELYVDDEEAFRGAPRQVHQRRDVARDVVHSLFPEHTKIIDQASKILNENRVDQYNTISDNITIIESWHLRSGPDAEDGKHLISLDSGVLLEESYDCERFPFVFLQWKRPIVGFWGIGIAEDITGIQIEINKLLQKIQTAFHHLSNPMVFIHASSGISKAHITPQIGVIVPYNGSPPIVRAAQTMHPEVFEHLERLYNRAFEIVGVSQLSASSRKPEGLESGTALREFNDIESERFSLITQDYETMFIEIAKLIIYQASELYNENEDLSTKVRGKKFIETIKWSEVDLEETQFVLSVSAASSLPNSRAGRVQKATEWFQASLIDAQEWRELLDIPDLEDATDLARAPRDYIKQVVCDLLEDGTVIEPEPWDDLNFAVKYATLSYQRAKLNGVDEERIALLEQYINSVVYLLEEINRKAMEQQQQQAALAAPPPAAAPQQSASIPQQPIEGV